jgi:hypothetical protein
MTTVVDLLKVHLSQLGKQFQPNELAYLSLTQKVEHAVRDKLAFSIHLQLEKEPSSLVCREWNRRDLAVLIDDKPALLLEAKAVYTFDIMKQDRAPHNYPELVADDVKKAMAWQSEPASSRPEVFTLLLATHPYNNPSRKYVQAIKYFDRVATFSEMKVSLQTVHQEVVGRMANHPLCHSGSWHGGKAFDIELEVAFWLFGPYQNSV